MTDSSKTNNERMTDNRRFDQQYTTVSVNNSPILIQDYIHPDDHAQPTYEMTPGFKPFA